MDSFIYMLGDITPQQFVFGVVVVIAIILSLFRLSGKSNKNPWS